ncbi:MAG: adenylate/guanylate cyclase domain-containing protein [Saprospiraceae bacterium]
MNKVFFLIYLVLFSFSLVAQTEDSEINPKKMSDSTEVISLIREAQANPNHKEKMLVAEKALELARNQNYSNGIAKCLGILNEQYKKGDDALKALSYALETLHNLKKEDITEKKYFMYMLIANIYLDYGSNNKALDYFLNANKNSGFLSQLNRARLFEKIGDAYAGLNQSQDANHYYNKAIDLLENYHEEQLILQKIADSYLKNGKTEQAVLAFNYIKEKASKNKVEKDIAIAANNIATIYHSQKKYEQALPYFTNALQFEKYLPDQTLLILYSNLGIAQQNLGNAKAAIQYLTKAIELSSKLRKPNEQTILNNILANIYLAQKDLFNAQKYNLEAERLSGKAKLEAKADVYSTAAIIYQQLYEYEKAFDYYKKYLELKDNLLLSERASQQDLQRQVFLLEKQEKELQLSLINKDVLDLNLKQMKLQREKLQLESAKQAKELEFLKQSQEMNATSLRNKELEKLEAEQKLALLNNSIAAIEKDNSLAALKQNQALQLVQLAQEKSEKERNLQAISLLTKDKELLTKTNQLLSQTAAFKELDLSSQRNFRRYAYGLGALLLVISLLIFRGLRNERKNNKQLEAKNLEIESGRLETEIERQKAEGLLLNILPDEIADELKIHGKAAPRHYGKVTVMFTDFSNFTSIASTLSPTDLITELNECFIFFDDIIEKYGLEKIKTIGDSYMCAGGIPSANDSNPFDTAKAALELQHFVTSRNQIKKKEGNPYFQMRIGIHTGEVVAGVVGKSKFAYDIWGDAVNLASRMESTCPENQINISETTFQLIKNQFNCTPRGEIEAKGKGKVMMYLLESEKIVS